MGGLPSINIVFQAAAVNTVQQSNQGVVALILKDAVPTKGPVITMNSANDIPASGLTADNLAQIALAWKGYVYAPKRVIAYILAADAADYSAAETYLETVPFDYLAVPGIASADATAMAAWVQTCRDSMRLKFIAVLPHVTANYEGVVDFETDGIVVGATAYTAAQYCARIAGILAGTPMYMSATFAPLPEVDDVPHLTEAQFDTAITAGQLVLLNDGTQVKIARAVNSLTTLSGNKTADWQKIKIVALLDKIVKDITSTANSSYIGKYANSYDNKVLLIAAINAYLTQLVNGTLLDSTAVNQVGIDSAANKAYLAAQGTDVSTLTDQQIKEASTGSEVLLAGGIKPLDAMEDITLNLTM